MWMKTFSAAALVMAAAAKTDDYSRFGALMDKFGFDWEPVKVGTDDGFILTTFHITGNKDGKFTPTMPPVLIMHGAAGDGATWIDDYKTGLPMHLQLAEAGYDVWIANNRGTEWSQEHITYSVDDPEFWEWSWAEMGLYDGVANIKAIKESTWAEKVFYIGWSQGNVQVFYALSHIEESFFADNVHKVIAMAPCTVNPPWTDESYYEKGLYQLQGAGIYDEYGPNWKAEYPEVCLVSEEACEQLNCANCQPMSIQSSLHWQQNTYTGRFQEFAPNYLDGERETDLIDIGSIDKVPIAMLVGKDDVTCPYSQAVITANIIGDMVTHFESIEGADHMYFSRANDKYFMDLVKGQLQVPSQEPEFTFLEGGASTEKRQLAGSDCGGGAASGTTAATQQSGADPNQPLILLNKETQLYESDGVASMTAAFSAVTLAAAVLF